MNRIERLKEAVFAAARLADHRYDGNPPDSFGMTRSAYIGKAVMHVLYREYTEAAHGD